MLKSPYYNFEYSPWTGIQQQRGLAVAVYRRNALLAFSMCGSIVSKRVTRINSRATY
jgi:hypothetical protein